MAETARGTFSQAVSAFLWGQIIGIQLAVERIMMNSNDALFSENTQCAIIEDKEGCT